MAELKPCPFCGCKDIIINTDGNLFSGYDQVAECQLCGASISRAMCDPKSVIDAWNQRASTDTEDHPIKWIDTFDINIKLSKEQVESFVDQIVKQYEAGFAKVLEGE